MFKIFKRSQLEARRIRWSSTKNTWKTFFTTMIILGIFVGIIAGFTLGMLAMFQAFGK